ncbi:alkaline phosphatase PafA [Chondrinema litorale]|uniref:alkaline phosphatase PafA n=1 Tax=Chondrinema litorale TaxID=2994555 RepID=UPI00254325D2|nr:alkaline phosphatase PafA [Chondrinema litorale]UZR98578.1 alkaline phosphatase family protein [Chondrinema litorale]
MKKLIIAITLSLMASASLLAQNSKKPKLIVGIVVDQMRADYLYRFQDNYTDGGFKRLMGEGFNAKNTHYNYVPTYTGPGHASIYSGTTPKNHGIVANDWFSRELNREVYCAEDSTQRLVDNKGVASDKFDYFSRSPKNLLTTNFADELKLSTSSRSKVIGISLKDRGAIFPAGHMADHAFWYNSNNGNFISSTYYGDKLPEWLVKFNKREVADSLLDLDWEPLLADEKYMGSNPDDSQWEKIYKGKKESVFPYKLKKLRKDNGNFGLITQVPYGNTLLANLAFAAIKGEKLGKGAETDMITISFSSTDYVGHNFGIRSKELEDTYIRLDKDIEALLNYLDKEVGKGEYILFLTADHAGSDNPDFLNKEKLPHGYYSTGDIKAGLNEHLSKKFGNKDYVTFIDGVHVYLDEKAVLENKELVTEAAHFLKNTDGIKEVFVPSIYGNNTEGRLTTLMSNGYNYANSGDIIIQFYSGWMSQRTYGTTHGTGFSSDTHVPLLWYGWNVPKGETSEPHTITQIVSTLSMKLNLPLPDDADLNPIKELVENK